MTDHRPEERAAAGRLQRFAVAHYAHARDVAVIALLLAGVLELDGIRDELSTIAYYHRALGAKLDVLPAGFDAIVAGLRALLFR